MTAGRRTIGALTPRERILDAACDLFGQRGVQAVAVDEIAAAALSNKMTLYRHFGSKENLAIACLRAVIDEIDSKWRVAELRDDPARVLDDWIDRMAAGCTGSDCRSELIFAVFRQARADAVARPLLDAFIARHRKRMAGICRKSGITDGETLSAALMLLAYGMRVNPWGLDGHGRSALFSARARMLVKLFSASPAVATPARGKAKPVGKRKPVSAARGNLKPRERIVAAGCTLFHKRGVLEANVDEIAAAAGSNKMTLYRHFGSKENLAAHCFKAALAEAQAILVEIEAASVGDAASQLASFVKLIADAFAGADKRLEMIGMAMRTMRNEAMGQALMRDFEVVERKWLARICRSLGVAEPEALADSLLLILHGVDVNSWGLSGGRQSALYLDVAGTIIDRYRSRPVKAAKRRIIAGKRST